MKQPRLRWGRVLIGGFLAELMVFVIVFPVLYVFGQRAFLTSILIASAVMPFIFAVWVGKRIESQFLLHGALVGVVAFLIYTAIAWGQTQPLLYKIAHGLVRNPKTQVAVSMNLLQRLNARDLAQLSVDRNVPEPVRIAARKKTVAEKK